MIIARRIKLIWLRIIWMFFRLFPLDNNKVVVCNFYGKGYGDNPKYIIDYLINQNSDLKIIWIVKNEKEAESLPKGMKYCCIDTLMYVYHMATAKVWVDNCRKGFSKKRKNQKYLQTWHGFALKRIEISFFVS